jgi:hypothetical protein
MDKQKYSVNQELLESIISWIRSGEIAIPEIQRPFVWKASKVRDLFDSLYKGYPVGYLINWRSPQVKLKDGKHSEGKKILIDGQQRIKALNAAILGNPIIDSNYKRKRITIAFHPLEERFEVFNTAIDKSKEWISDIGPIVRNDISTMKATRQFLKDNEEVDEDQVEQAIEALRSLTKKQIGVIELSPELDIDTVTEIFIRINSEGVKLNQADFAMSRIAADEKYGGNMLRKAIDYFCHLAVSPEYHDEIEENDTEFAKSEFWPKIEWLKNEKEDLYDPEYKDVLRVAFIHKFNRGKFSDLVNLLSGRNFETRTFEERIAEESYQKLTEGVKDFINETNFKRFMMIVRSAGFIHHRMIQSYNALNFAYAVYLKMVEQGYKPGLIEQYVKKWLVLSLITQRYTRSPETQINEDIRNIEAKGITQFVDDVEKADLTDTFWEVTVPEQLITSSASNPVFGVFLASQCAHYDRGFLSKDITVKDMVDHRGDVHHLFPKEMLKQHGYTQSQFNQVANYVYTQQEINIAIGKKPPTEYMHEVLEQVQNGQLYYGYIKDQTDLQNNLKENAIPESLFDGNPDNFQDFLQERRRLIGEKLKGYYWKL